jgi:hypothetical protein
MKKVDGFQELWHRIMGHVTVVRSGLEVVRGGIKGDDGGLKEVVEKMEGRVKLLVKDLEQVKKMAEGVYER